MELVCDRVAVVDHGKVIAVGSIEELLRGADLVRVRVGGLNGNLEGLRGFQAPAAEGEWLTFREVAEERVPELVDELVRLGARVYAVEPRRQSLEDRFLELLQVEEA